MLHSEIIKKSNQISKKHISAETPVLSILSSCTLDFIKPYIITETYKINSILNPYTAPFNQFEQILIDDNNEIWSKPNELFWINLRLEDLFKNFMLDHTIKGSKHSEDQLYILLERITTIIELIRSKSSKPILISSILPVFHFHFNIFDMSDPEGINHIIPKYNKLLATRIKDFNDTYILDFNSFIYDVGYKNLYDPKLAYMARFPINYKIISEYCLYVSRFIARMIKTSSKVIVVDLDNTLWGGVLGDDGIDGIKLGEDYPGSVYKDIQRALKIFKNRGFLLAISSKNDMDLVMSALKKHPEMILKVEDFVSIYANWDNKADNIIKMADELNLGLESFIFIDDNPVERNLVKNSLPMIEVLELPNQDFNFLGMFKHIKGIDKINVLEEDLKKTEMYKSEFSRKSLQKSLKSNDEFLKSLKMTSKIEKLNSLNKARIHQLINKTNQFNLTTKRYSVDEITAMDNNDNYEIFCLSLSDKFGDLGLVACIILKKIEKEKYQIDSFIMSCRVMGRKVEYLFINYIIKFLMKRKCKALEGVYIPSKRNHIVKNFYQLMGFKNEIINENNEKLYEMNLNMTNLLDFSIIKLIK
tara:strand:+ start:4887 stop:6650 length:1764 start_codon:yes stop_codon:yes gene_type:complete